MKMTFSRSLLLTVVGFLAPGVRGEAVWTAGSCAPAEWTALGGNILLGHPGSTTSDGVPGYTSGTVTVLTDGAVPAGSPDKEGLFGFRSGETLSWEFSAPVTIETLRLSAAYLSSASYDGVHVAKAEVLVSGESAWTEIAGDGEYKGGNAAGKINFLVLTNGDLPVAENIVALRITFGSCETGFANYYTEIEAVGRLGSIRPFLDSFGIEPAKTKAKVTGIITDCGTDATACSVYLSLDGGVPVRIAKRVTGSFAYRIEGLRPETTYAYTLSVSNNAPSVKGLSRSGTFTTMAADAQTASWSAGEYSTEAWAPLENNLLGGLAATEISGLSPYASSDSSVLTDGSVPCPDPLNDGEAGQVTVGFRNNGSIAWVFDKPATIEKIRLSSYWWQTQFNGISVNAVEVKYKDAEDWSKLDVPPVNWKGGTARGQTQTLTDPENGFVAQDVVGLKLTFGDVKAGIANYYAEIEAVRHVRPKTSGFSLQIR